MWYFNETGSGRPLILLHGIGMSHVAWNAVTPYLASTRRVIAFDTAGFGLTPPLPGGIQPTIPNLLSALDQSLREMGLEVPVDIAGNSLGGYMALEAARRGIARSVVAVSPSGLWLRRPKISVEYGLKSLRLVARHCPGGLKAAMRMPMLRELTLAVPISVGSRHMPVADARRAVDDLARSPVFVQTFDSTRAPFWGCDIAVPVTVAFGDHDWILPKGCQRRDTLPAHTKWIVSKGWGHVPMWLDPVGVSQLILAGTAP